MTEPLPCLACGRPLQAVSAHEAMQHQPHDAVVCTTHGNYGSTVFDAMDGSWLQFNICDECLILAGLQGRVVQCRDQVHHEVTSERWSPDAG